MSNNDRRDLVRFLLELGRPAGESAAAIIRHSHTLAEFCVRSGAARSRAVAVLEAAGQP